MPVSGLPKGLNFTRAIIALALSEGEPRNAAAYAASRWGSANAAPRLLEKAAVGAGTLVNLSDAVTEGGAETEFWALVAQRSIVGQLTGLRRMPFQTPTIALTTGVSADFVGEGAGKPVVRPALTKLTGMPRTKLAAVSVYTKELLSATEAEASIRDELVRAIVQALDVAFIDPSNAGTTNVKPASVTFGATDATGGSPASASLADDLEALIGGFTGDLQSAYLVTSPLLATKLSGADRPDVGARGGSWGGIPVITSTYVPAGLIVLIDPTGIAIAEGVSEIKTSDKGAIEMSDAPTMTSATPTAAQPISLWQTNSVAILAEREINWRKVRSGAVSIVSNAFGY